MSEWNRVYQGGHHDIWCNGEAHKKTNGGFCHPDHEGPTAEFKDSYPCDCKYWKSLWNKSGTKQ